MTENSVEDSVLEISKSVGYLRDTALRLDSKLKILYNYALITGAGLTWLSLYSSYTHIVDRAEGLDTMDKVLLHGTGAFASLGLGAMLADIVKTYRYN